MDVKDVLNAVDTKALLDRPLTDWREPLAKECGCYVFGENYIVKRFDAINYKFCVKDEAKEVLTDNLYALLRYKYFPKPSEDIDDRIDDIIKSFTANLKTTLIRVSFDKNADCEKMEMLPDYCIAFRNGVFNFKDNCWLFKYDIISLTNISNKIYNYDPKWAIMWYMDYDFESLDIDLPNTNLKDFVKLMKDFTSQSQNYCFELAYNIAHDTSDKFNLERFNHLCEIIGFTILQSFSQHFVMLIGAGQNGKNSLFDGCFSCKVVPRPSSNDLDAIENDRFITGSLENKSHNIFLETSTSAKTYTESKMIKALTGSMYQTIEQKGVNKYSGIINCKHIFSANDQDKVKFADTTTGFRRRINMLEIYYQWDSEKKFMKRGDYYDSTFSDDLSELKDDVLNTTLFIYLGMFGIKSATKNFERNFQFTTNDWNSYKYAAIDVSLKEKIENITLGDIVARIESSRTRYDEFKTLFFDMNKTRLYLSPTMRNLGYKDYDDMICMFKDPEAYISYFSENDVYMSVRAIQTLVGNIDLPGKFTLDVKKIYNLTGFENIFNNKPYVHCTFRKGNLHVLN